MKRGEIRLVYMTVPDARTGRELARHAVSSRLAACANILDGVQSLFWWDGALQDEQEALVLLKTRADLVERLRRELVERHPYACPCVVTLPIESGHAPFLEWVVEQTQEEV